MNLRYVASVALGAQRRLHAIAWSETRLQLAGQLTVEAAAGIAAYRAIERCKLDGCAAHFASLASANEGAYTPEPEPELA
jgi:hypothetical protein